jgi:DNA-binding XRE family transcriptional regulator
MKKTKKEFFESKGWKVCDAAWEAVGMSPEEAELAETKFQMARKVKKMRSESGITQAQLSKKMGTSQPYVAALENSPPSATLDSLFRAFRALGVSARDFGRMFGSSKLA